jgi:hypothetical protein
VRRVPQVWRVGWPARPAEANSTDGNAVYTNFEVVDIDRFYRSNRAVRALTERIDASRGAYWGRWGDSVVRLYTLALHYTPQDTHFFCDWNYEHQNHYVSGVMCAVDVLGRVERSAAL